GGRPTPAPDVLTIDDHEVQRLAELVEVGVRGCATRESVFLELGENARVDRVEDDHGARAMLVHERDRLLEIPIAAGVDVPRLRWMSIDARDELCHRLRQDPRAP